VTCRLRRAITILITAHGLFATGGYHHRFWMSEPSTQTVFSDILEIDTLELSKVPQVGDGTKLWEWMKFIGSRTEQELDMAAALDPVIGKAATIVRSFSADEEARLRAEAREKGHRDYISAIHHAEEIGLEQGLEQGREESRQTQARSIRNALNQGLSPDLISRIFSVTVEEVSQIAAGA
jgi:predicted transposase/invertase (TIGR01784 family)